MQHSEQETGQSVGLRVRRIVTGMHVAVPLFALGLGLLLMLGATVSLIVGSWDSVALLRVLTLALCGSLLAFGLALYRLRRELIEPLARLEDSVSKVCSGEPGATLSLNDTGVLRAMVSDLDSLNEELSDLYEDMDSRVSRHTTRLAQKTASLKILYDVAASVNQAQDLEQLLLRFLRVLKEMVNGLAATVRLEQPDGIMRVVGSIGINNEVLREREMLPLALCVCGKALSAGDVLCDNPARHCVKQLRRVMFGHDDIEMVSVPLDYHGELLGMYYIAVRKPGISGREDILELLQTIGSHLGMAVAKQRSDREARRLSIMEERTTLAHELHDSLAQTLASLRFQVRLLEDLLTQEGGSEAVTKDAQRIRAGLDEAHIELRELLNSFRAPVDQRGLVSALEKLVERFGRETGTHVLFQNECREPNLSSAEEMQMLRVAQECLANIRKHAHAHTVRVLLSCRSGGAYCLLIEDDGVGFEDAAKSGRPGEHIGLSIMEERARRLGGNLRIESEVGEGTRVELTYQPQLTGRRPDRRWII
ncbi:MAG: GAF domain-containing protein [Gammaproteobacteria bacterium]|nr:GAF domain-containing protein [Gammaproteobacteria bacterium]